MADLGHTGGPFRLSQGQGSQKILATLLLNGALVPSLTSPTITLSKAGAPYAAPSLGTWAELAGGDYTILLDETDTNTLGWMMVRITHGSADETRILCWVALSDAEVRTDYIRTRHIKGRR